MNKFKLDHFIMVISSLRPDDELHGQQEHTIQQHLWVVFGLFTVSEHQLEAHFVYFLGQAKFHTVDRKAF